MSLSINDGVLRGRLVAIVVLTAVSAGSFVLGYFVGSATTPAEPQTTVKLAYAPDTDPIKEPVMDAKEEETSPITLRPQFETPQIEVPEPAPEYITKEPAKSPATTKRVAKKKTSTASQGKYSVQAGVFGEKRYADALLNKLKGKGYDAFIDNSRGQDGITVYRVKVGSFGTHEEASDFAARLKKLEGLQAFVTDPG